MDKKDEKPAITHNVSVAQDELERWRFMGCKDTSVGGEGGVHPYPGPFVDDRA